MQRKTHDQPSKNVKKFATTEDSLAIFQWQLLTLVKKQGHSLDLSDSSIKWLLNSADALEKIMTSGDVQNDRWKEVVEIIAEITRQDANAKEGVKLNLAIAIGLTFSSDVRSTATGSIIDGIKRYHSYAKWIDERVLFDQFYTLNVWQMRYVVCSLAEDEELVWARANALESYRTPGKIATVVHEMVAYNKHNKDGVSVHRPGYYYYKPVTLEWIHKIGGVCGAISRFGSSMAQAFGIPATVVGQPGHAAIIWLKDGLFWTLSNDIYGWEYSKISKGTQYTWRIEAPFLLMMHQAQKNPEGYILSEKLRIIAESFSRPGDSFELLEDATTICPQNYDVWNVLKESFSAQNLNRDVIETSLLPTLLKYEEERLKISNIATSKTVKASSNQDSAHVILSGSRKWVPLDELREATSKAVKTSSNKNSKWVSSDREAWIEIDLGTPCTIDHLKIHWWGFSKSKDFDVQAEVDGRFVNARSESDEQVDGSLNAWSTINGWEMKTTKILFKLRDGQLDPWNNKYYFGIRQIFILGMEHYREADVSLNKPIATNTEDNGKALVDGDAQTLWTSKKAKSWIEMDLGQLCTVSEILLDWNNGIEGMQTVEMNVGGSKHKTIKTIRGEFTAIPTNEVASGIKIILSASKSYTLREIKAIGACHTAIDILKMKIAMNFKDYPYLEKNLVHLLD